MSFLSLSRVGFSFPGWPHALHDIDLHIEQGEMHCLVGRSGSGKTTLLKIAAGLLSPATGTIALRGRAPAAQRADIGFMFQSPTLLEWRRVIDNVLLPVSLQRPPSAEDRRKARQLLAQLGLAEHSERYPRQLSGGQQSRVALARAMVLEPVLLLLDEPFAALDAITREELQQDLLATCSERGTTALFVTHDIGEAVFLGDRVTLLREGAITRQLVVPLARPRSPGQRDTPAFAAMKRALREAMGAAAVERGVPA